MKFNVEVECTPDEARRFFGLPDVAPMQAEIMNEVQDKILNSIRQSDAQELMKQWVPMSVQGVEAMKSLWSGWLNAAQNPQNKK